MPRPLTDKQAAFAKAYAEQPANAKSMSDAYRASRDASQMSTETINANAKKLMRLPAIRARIAELEQANPPAATAAERPAPTPDTPAQQEPTPVGVEQITYEQGKFALAYVTNGEHATRALLQTWPEKRNNTPGSRHTEAWRLLSTPAIKLRVAELKAQLGEFLAVYTDVSLDRCSRELGKLAFSNIYDFLAKNDETGKLVLDLENVDPAHFAAVAEYTESTDKSGVTTRKVKLADKRGPIDSLVKIQGGFAEDNKQKGEAMGEAAAIVLSELDRARAIAFALAKGKRDNGNGG